MTDVEFLSFDPGHKHIGVAISQHGQIAESLTTISAPQFKKQLKEILKIINQHNPRKIIIGFPSSGPIQKTSQRIANRLQQKTQIPLEFVNEEKSSLKAKDALLSSGKSPQKMRRQIHQASAASILQTYLDDLIQ